MSSSSEEEESRSQQPWGSWGQDPNSPRLWGDASSPDSYDSSFNSSNQALSSQDSPISPDSPAHSIPDSPDSPESPDSPFNPYAPHYNVGPASVEPVVVQATPPLPLATIEKVHKKFDGCGDIQQNLLIAFEKTENIVFSNWNENVY
jgi:hypothetical protein